MEKVCKVEKVRSTFHTFHDYLNYCGEKKDDGLLTIYAITQSGFVEVRQQVEVSSCYTSPKLTASVNEVVLGIDENTPMDLLANVIKVLKNA